MFLVGFAFLSGPSRTFQFFTARSRLRGTVAFFLGVVLDPYGVDFYWNGHRVLRVFESVRKLFPNCAHMDAQHALPRPHTQPSRGQAVP